MPVQKCPFGYDAHLAHHRQHVLDLLGGDFLRPHDRIALFVVDVAALLFTGLEKIISARSRPGSIGFGAKVISPEDRKQGEIFRDVEPEDLLKYGLIPEFVSPDIHARGLDAPGGRRECDFASGIETEGQGDERAS